jgi:predicted nucleic acid-binding protein
VTEVYLDSSAFVKLVTNEPESAALSAFLIADNPSGDKLRLVASDLTYAESVRAAKRHSEPAATKIFELFEAVFLIPLTSSTYRRAAFMSPSTLRTLDAIHVSAALELARSSLGIISYDTRLIGAAHAVGLRTFSPT